MKFLINWISKFWNDEPKKEKSDFSIEYYPLTERYYPKYKDFYLSYNHSTGITETEEPYLFAFANYGKTKEEAEEIIIKFKEHWMKTGVQIIPVD